MRVIGLIHLLALSLIVNSSTASTGAQINVIRGKVRSAKGTTLNNAIVELRIGGGAIISQTVTRNDGDFSFSGLTSGEYEVVVALAGYEPRVELVRFKLPPRATSMEVLNVEVTLDQKPEVVMAAPGTTFVQEVPSASRSLYEKGVGKLRDRKSDEGMSLLKEAIAGFNEYFDAHFELGAELFRRGRYDEALESLERARQINERQPAVYFTFGLVMIRQQKFAVAEYAFGEAIRLDANNALSHFYRGVVLIELALRTSDPPQRVTYLAEAEKQLDRAWDLSGKRATLVMLQRARVYEARGDREAAAGALEKYLRAEPDSQNADEIRAAIQKLRINK